MHNAYRPVVKSLIAPKPGTVAPGMPTVTYLQSRALANDSAKRMALAPRIVSAPATIMHTSATRHARRPFIFFTHALPLSLRAPCSCTVDSAYVTHQSYIQADLAAAKAAGQSPPAAGMPTSPSKASYALSSIPRPRIPSLRSCPQTAKC